MPWEVTSTVLTAIFGSTILVFLLWGIHQRLIPHLRSHHTIDMTTPLPLSHTNGATAKTTNHHRLRSSLYSNPSTNFIDPRNSIADTELRRSRWSTSIHDLDLTPTSPRSLASPKTHMSRFETRSPRVVNTTPLGLKSPRPKSLMSAMAGSPGSTLPRSPCIHFKNVSTTEIPRSPMMPDLRMKPLGRPESRKRSQSDSLLERSHAALYRCELTCKRDTSMSTDLTGSTLQESIAPTGSQEKTRAAVYTANTSKIRSPLPR